MSSQSKRPDLVDRLRFIERYLERTGASAEEIVFSVTIDEAITALSGDSSAPETSAPYWVQGFWSPCKHYLVTVCVSDNDISVLDDNGTIWEEAGPREDMTDPGWVRRETSKQDTPERDRADAAHQSVISSDGSPSASHGAPPLTSNQCIHPSLISVTTIDGIRWFCSNCQRVFLPSGETALEREIVRLRAAHDAALAEIKRLREMVGSMYDGFLGPEKDVEPFVVKHYVTDIRPSIKGNGFDGLHVGDDREEAQEFVNWINSHLYNRR